MKKLSKDQILSLAYGKLCDTTPLKYDCGKLCGAVCCKSGAVASEGESGMRLLPGEKEYLTGKGFRFSDSEDGVILLCGGKCDRRFRPFMCRIFPYYPRLTEENGFTRISLRSDPAAFRFCPLAVKQRHLRSSAYFRRNAVHAVRLLLGDEDMKKDLITLSLFSDNMYELYKKMFD